MIPFPARLVPALLLPAALAALAAPAAGADLGVPKEGYDRVLLDDGRVVDARALPREGDVIPLEFPAGTLRVPRARVVEVRPWREFDPAPRDAAEKEKTDRGFVRWKGVLVPPERAAAQRAEEIAKERDALAAANRLEDVEKIREVPAGPFRVRCNGPTEDRKIWCAVLADLGKQVAAVMPKVEYPPTIDISIDGAAPLDRDGLRPREHEGRNGIKYRDSDKAALLGFEGVSREDGVRHLLYASALRLVENFVFWDVLNSTGWVRHGLAEYFSFAEERKGGLEFGAVDDALLLRYREMEAKGGLPDLTALLRSGNQYTDELVEKKKATGEWERRNLGEDTFDSRFDPAAWMLVHYLMEGDGGKHRKAFLGWFQCVADFDNKIGRSHAYQFDSSRDFLLRQIKVKDLDTLAAAVQRHAAGLEYRDPGTWIALAREALAKAKDPEEARALVGKAVARAAGDAGALLEAGLFLASLPDGAAGAREVLEAAVAADPLHGDARCALAALLPPGEAEPMRALGESLGGRAPAAAARAADAPAPPK